MKKNYSKIISYLFVVVFVLLFSYFNWEDYKKHYEIVKKQQLTKIEVLTKVESFSLAKVRNLDKIDLYYTPYKDLINKLTYKIENAKYHVYLEVYMLTETRIQNALLRAKQKWIDVKVVLEKNPYMSPWLNKKAFEFLKNRWIDVVYSNSKNFSLNHSKMILIDNEIFLSTGNFTYSSFAHNREFMFFINDIKLYSRLEELFLWDYSWILTYVYDDDLVISPSYSRIKIEKILNESKESIKMYFPYLSDEKLLKILINKAKTWVKIELILWQDSKDDWEDINRLKENNIKIKVIKSPKIHSKSILIDDKYLYLGSINFSKYSLDVNREIWVIFSNIEAIEKFKKVFKKDFKK